MDKNMFIKCRFIRHKETKHSHFRQMTAMQKAGGEKIRQKIIPDLSFPDISPCPPTARHAHICRPANLYSATYPFPLKRTQSNLSTLAHSLYLFYLIFDVFLNYLSVFLSCLHNNRDTKTFRIGIDASLFRILIDYKTVLPINASFYSRYTHLRRY